jgi:DNA-binding CsgD family transcriptional regulator
MIIDEDDYLAHYGTPRKSGRYPYGSGGDPAQRNREFLDIVDQLKRDGLSDVEIAEAFEIKTTQLRARRTIANNERKREQIAEAEKLKEKGWSNSAIGRQMGINESSVRALLAPGAKEKSEALLSTANMLKEQVDIHKYVDVGRGVENYIGVTKERLRSAIAILKEEGYRIHYTAEKGLGTGKDVSKIVLTGAETTGKEVYANRDKIMIPTVETSDYGKTFSNTLGMLPPISVDPKRVGILYAKDGGAQADGVIYVRPGVPDVSLGNNKYAQVRILVDKTHYLKGMALYKDDLPKGIDLLFNTNKEDTGNKLDALKPITDVPDNPFGAIVRQLRQELPDGTKGKLTSAMNLVNEEGDWEKWSRTLSRQVLSKQSPSLAKEQLDINYENRIAEYQSIMSMTNPTVRRKLLQEFSDSTDSSAVHLKAASMPRQATKVILPVNSLKQNEVYAPGFKDGELVALIRFPHGGTFEIPELTVNNRHAPARKLLGDTKDAIGINSRVAERLSGADFDGDTVLVIPNNNKRIKSTPALEDLKDFNPREKYRQYDGMKVISEQHMQKQMGDITNLITDMTIRKATASELARAVKHSMVVIDSHKHKLDYKQSAKDNNISQLKLKYQGSADSGATTIFSLAESQAQTLDRRPRRAADGGPINKLTGALEYEYTGATYTDKKGRVKAKPGPKSVKLAETRDASTLSSGTPIERVYVSYSNNMKALANQARLDMINTPRIVRSPSAAKVYSTEVSQLKASLTIALRNAPLERKAQSLAGTQSRAIIEANPGMDNTQRKRIEAQSLSEMRIRVGAKKIKIEITPKQWEAIQAGAIADSVLKSILDNADMEIVRSLALPKTESIMSSSKIRQAKRMLDNGYTRTEVADQLGVSVKTLDRATVDS